MEGIDSMFAAVLAACGLGAFAAGGSVVWTPVLLTMGILIDRNRRVSNE